MPAKQSRNPQASGMVPLLAFLSRCTAKSGPRRSCSSYWSSSKVPRTRKSLSEIGSASGSSLTMVTVAWRLPPAFAVTPAGSEEVSMATVKVSSTGS